MKFEMTRNRALELGLLVCKCGYPENNHFSWGTRPCAFGTCKEYRETGRHGIRVLKETK